MGQVGSNLLFQSSDIDRQIVTAARTIMNEPFRFHDGLTLPVGSSIAFPIGAIQKDAEFFSDPLTFNGFRFVDSTSNDDALKNKEGSGSAQTISPTNLVYVLFLPIIKMGYNLI